MLFLREKKKKKEKKKSHEQLLISHEMRSRPTDYAAMKNTPTVIIII